jgi:hypothetical protein
MGRGCRHCLLLKDWFDFRNHVCIVCERLGPSLYDFLRKNNYRPFPVDLVRDFGRQLLESVACRFQINTKASVFKTVGDCYFPNASCLFVS